jgi:hypothetical protein
MQNDRLDGELERRALAQALERLLAAGDAKERRGAPWDITMPAGLDGSPPSQFAPFEEGVWGIATRELAAPQVFRHYFAKR